VHAESSQSEVFEIAAQLYRDRYMYLLRIALVNAASEADAEEALQEAFASFVRAFDPQDGAPPLAWLTLTLKRQCWRQRREAHLDRQLGQEAERGGEELGSVIEAIPSTAPDLEQRTIERDDTRRRLGGLKPEERTALGLLAAGFSYEEIGRRRGWTYTKVNSCIAEGRAALRSGTSNVAIG
jgi:RNA polymerase sigma factor (sigma-70 family)